MTTMRPELQDGLISAARPLAPDGLPGPAYGGVVVLPDVKFARRATAGTLTEAGMEAVTEESSLHDLLDVVGQAMETVGTEQARRNLGEIAARLGRFQAALSTWCAARDTAVARLEARGAEADQREARLTRREAAAAEREAISRLREEALAVREASLHRAVDEYAARQRRLREREADLHCRECVSAVATAARLGRFVAAACVGRGLFVTRRRDGVGQRAVSAPRSCLS